MWLRVIPVALFAAAPNFIAIVLDYERPLVPGDDLCHNQPVSVCKVQFPSYDSEASASSGHGQGRVKHTGMALLQSLDEVLVFRQGPEWIHAGQSSR